LFAALMGNGGCYEILFRGLSGEESQGMSFLKRIAETGLFGKGALANIGKIISEDPMSFLIMIFVGLAILVLFCFLVWIVVVSQAALVDSSAKLISNENNKDLGIQKGVNVGIKNFWPVFTLNAVAKVFISLFFLLLGFLAFSPLNKFGDFISGSVYLVSFVVFISVSIIFLLIVKYSVAYIVIRGSSIVESIQQGWSLFRKNWLVSIEMAFILFFINLLVGFSVALIILVLAVPLLFLALILYKLVSIVGFWIIAIMAIILFIALIVLSGAFLASFQIAAWTGLFLQLIGKGGVSKIERIASRK